MSDTLEETTTVIEAVPVNTDDGDHDTFSHYVRKEDILKAAVEGIPVKAICGKKWVPHKDPEKYPVCPDCQKIYDQLAVG